MKKRILALALAGTTAFSVFGAAMSANAATLPDDLWNAIKDYFDSSWSSHEDAHDGAEYHSYNETGDMRWGASSEAPAYVGITNGFLYNGSLDNLKTNDAGKLILDKDKVIAVPWANGYDVDEANGISYGDATKYIKEYSDKFDDFDYYANYDEFAKAAGYTHYAVNGTGGEADRGNVYDDTTLEYVIATSNADPGQYFIFTIEDWRTNNREDAYTNAGVENATAGDTTGAGHYFLKGEVKEGGSRVYTLDEMKAVYTRTVNPHYAIATDDVDDMAFAKLDTNLPYVTQGDLNNAYVVATEEGTLNGALREADGTIVTKLVGGLDTLEEVMAEEVKYDDVAYAYDFDLPLNEDDFLDAWEDGSLYAKLSWMNNGATSGFIYAETGIWGVSDIREEVIYAWEDFLDNIGVSDLTERGLTKWATATIENYVYQYTDDVTVRVSTVNNLYDIYVVTTEKVDLYNFEQLIADIMNRAPSAAARDAQTSELVYLMQQYYKYTEGGYVDVKPVETDDWGDLLVALAQAPTEDEFSTAAAYRRYTNKVEDLVEQYMEAETSAAVDMAEDELYDFVTDYFSTYRYAAKADTTVLENAIDKLFFNYDWEEDYTVETKVDTKKYGAEAYPGAMDKDGDLDEQNYVDPYDYGRATYAMYPGKDYGDSTNKVKNYPGVNDAIDYSGLNSSYFWFANVYTLAYNVYQNNEYQSVIDLMAETLNEAVDNLSVNSLMNAQPSDILGAEEANEKLDARIETDYTAAMWGDISKINSFITDRVSAEEIGETGTNNAEKIAELVESAAKLQRNQSVVTRSEIDGTAGVKTALKNAQTTLAALEKDDDNYNAAQATALKNAINDCQEIIDLYNGNYSTSMYSQSVNGKYDGKVGDKDQILKSDITGAIQAVEDAINFKNVIQGWTETENGWKYGVEDTYDSALTWGVEDTLEGPHYLNFGWAKIGNTWFYFDDEGIAKESDWLQVGNDWYYFNSNCGAAIGWAKVDDQWYYFNQGCKMMTGWQKVDGNWYYLKPSGAMATGWCQVGGKWYYLSQESNSLGQMLYSTTTPDGYQVGADGALVE